MKGRSMRSSSSSRGVPPRPVYSGKETTGRVKSLTRGQGCGMISAADGDVFFHKADFKGEFFDLQVGDRVVFELLNDTISGKRAQNVRVAPTRKAR
jgi:cold shock CspA family protein